LKRVPNWARAILLISLRTMRVRKKAYLTTSISIRCVSAAARSPILSACLKRTTLVLAAVTNDLLVSSTLVMEWEMTYIEAEECMIVEKSAFVPDPAAISWIIDTIAVVALDNRRVAGSVGSVTSPKGS
jgi:hypothetical protein